MVDSNLCLGSVFFCSTNVVPCTTEILMDILSRSNRKEVLEIFMIMECKANNSTSAEGDLGTNKVLIYLISS